MLLTVMRYSLVALLLVLLSTTAYTQSPRVKVRFEVDGKSRKAPADINFYRPDGQLLAKRSIANDTFEPPPLGTDKIKIVARLAGRTMDFEQVPPAFFAGSWLIGIDTPPFDDENTASAKSRTKEVWFIVFEPPNSEAIRATVAIPR